MNRKKRLLQKKSLSRGSITVEGAYIVSLVTLVIFLVLVFQLFVYARTWHTLAACETAASFECTGRKTADADFEEQKLQSLIQSGPILSIPKTSKVSRNGETLAIEIGGHATSPWLLSGWDYSRRIQVKQHKPVQTLRKIRALKKLIQFEF